MDKFSELKAAAMAATPGRIGDRIDGSGSIKYECTGYDGSLVLRTDHKDMEYGFVGDNADADELFFRLCVPDVVLELLAELEAKDKRIAELETKLEESRETTLLVRDAWQKDKERADAAEKRLATPVRLPTQENYDDPLSAHLAINDSADAIRAAGFTVSEE